MRWLLGLAFVGACLLLPGAAHAQEAAAAPSPEATKYHEMLRRRPQTGVVFDRFLAAWLANGSRDSLGQFLLKKSEASEGTAADLLILALFHSAEGRDADALAACEKAAQKSPDDPLLQLRTAEIANRLKQWDTALAALTRTTQLGLTGESDIRAARLHSETLWRLGRMAEAKDVFRKLIARHPEEYSLREEFVDMLVEHGLKPEAAEESRALVDLTKDPLEKAMRRMRLADLLVDLRRAPQARAELDLSLAQSGADSWLEGETLDRMERLYRRSGDVAGLAKKLADLAAQHPQRVAITRRQMRVLTELQRPADASAIAAELLQRTPGRRDVREEYVTLLEAQGNVREAITHMEELLRQQPDDGELMLRLAALHARNSTPDRTRELIALFLKQSPDDEGALMKAGQLLERLALDDAARSLYEKWMLDHPLDPFAGMALASLTHRQGDAKGAIVLWRRIAATGDVTVASQVASTMNNRGEALAAFEVLKEHEKDLLDNPRLLTQLCRLAVQANHEAACLRWLRRYAQLTKDPGELQRLVELTATVLNRQSSRKQLLDSFAATAATGTGETILHALAHELTTPENSYEEARAGKQFADELLIQAWAALPHPNGEPFSMDESLVETARVQVLTRRRDFPGVLRILSESIKRPGGKTSTRLQALTEASAAAFNYEEALRWVNEWKAVAQGSHLPWRMQATLLRGMGRTEEMLAVLRQAAQQFEDREEMTFDLANALSTAGQATEALAVYRRLFDQKDETTHRLRIGAQMVRTAKSSGQLDLLREEWKQRQREYPDSPEPWQLLAMLYREKPDVESQCRALAEALRLAPKDIGLIRELAASEDARGNTEKAAELYRQASRSDTSAQAKRSYAEFLLKRGVYDEAVVIMQEIAEAQATTTREIEELADALMELRLWNEAVTLLEGPAQMHAQNVRLQYQKAVALEESGQLDEAARHFIRVLQTNEEMVDAIPLPALQRAPLVPENPGAMWWYRLREHGDLAYQYRQWATTNMPSFPANRAGTDFHVLLPQCLEEAQVFALRHLARLGEIGRAHTPPRPVITLPEGIPMASLWTHVIVGQRDGQQYLHATTEQVRAHPVLLAEWLRGWLEIIDLPKDGAPALWTLAGQQFAGTQTNLAAEGALFHAFACPADQRTAHLERALKLANRTKDGKERLALLAASLVNEMSVSMMPGLNPRAPLSERDESLVINALTSWARDAAAVDGTPGGILSHAASTLASHGHWEEWRDLLDEAVPKIRNNAASHAVQAGWRNTGSYSYQSLPFPPSFYSGYDIGPRACLPGTLDWGIGETAERAPAALADGAKEPLVKLLCLHAAGRTEELKQEANRLAAAYPDREDVLFLKASVLAMDNESDELTNALHQWATAPVSEEVSRSRAPHLVGITADAKLPADEAMQSALLAAVKHLVSLGNITDGRSDGTPEALKVAGFVSQGQMLAGAMVSNGGNATIRAPQKAFAFTSSVAQQMMARVDSTADSGEGLRILTETLRRYAADEIAQADGYMQYSTDSGWQWLREALYLYKRSTYRESVVLHLRAEAGTPRLKREEAAFIIDRLGDSSDYAKELYRVALENDPGNTKIRLRAICQVLEHGSDDAAKIYRQAPLEDRIQIGNTLARMPGGNNPMLTQMLANLAGNLLRDAARKKETPEDLRWIITLTTWHAWTGEANQSSGIRELLRTEATPAEAGFGSAPLPESVNRRSDGSYYLDDQFIALCEAAMDVPAFALTSFTSYAGLKLKQGATVESLVPRARKALEIGDPSMFPDMLLGFSRIPFHEPRDVWQPSPLALLALHASRQTDPHAAFNELASLARSCKILGGDRLVAALEQLYTCKEADFAKAARDFSNVPYAAGLWMDCHPTVTVARIWRERRLKLDPAPLVLPEADKVMSYFSWISGSGIVLKAMAERGEHEEAKAFLVKALEACIGPRAHWQDYVSGVGHSYRDQGVVRLSTVLSLMDNISEVEPMLAFVSFELGEEAGFRTRSGYGLKDLTPSWMTNENQFSGTARNSPDAALNFLAASPWLKPGGTLWDCPLDPDGKTTVLTQYALAVRMLDKDDQAGIRATLQHAAAQNPNAAFLCALIEKDQLKLVDALALANENIANAPDYAVEALGVILETELSPTQKATAEARSPQVFTTLRKVDDINSARNAEAFFTTRKVEALRMSDREFEDTMRRAASQLATTNRAKAVKLLDRACELITDKESRVGWNASSGNNGWSACGQAIKLWCHETQSLDVVAVACDLFHQPDEFNAVSSGWWYKPSWGGAILTNWEAGGGKANPAAGLESVLRALHEKLAIKNAPLLVLAFMDFHLKLDAWQRMEVLRAADALATGDSEVARYAQWLILAFQLNDLADAERWLPGSQDPAMTKRVMDGFRAIIADESTNPIVRLSLAHCLLNRVGKRVDADLTWKSMDLATLALEREWPVHGYMMLDVLNGVNLLPADDRYKAAAARWLPAWLHRNRFNGVSARMGKDYNPIGAYQSAVLTLAARGMDDTGLRQVVRTLDGGPQYASGNLLMLIRNGRMGAAREFFMQAKDQLIRTTDNGVVPEESDWPKIEEFAKSLPHPDQRMQVLVFCGGLYGEGMLEDRWADSRAFEWNRRMGEHARKVMEHPFQDPRLKDRLMLEIADAPGAVAEMKQELMEKDLRDLVRVASFGSGPGPVWMSLRYPMELTLNSLAESIRKTPEEALAASGTVFPGPPPAPLGQAQLDYQTLLERVDSGRDSRPKAECMRQIEGNLFESTMLNAPSMRGTLLAGFLPAWNKILRAYSGEKERFEEEGLGVATQIVLAGLSGKNAEIQAWREDVPHYRRDALKAQFLEKRHLMVVAEQLCRLEADKWRSIDERWKLVQAFAADPWVAEYFKDSRDTISQVVGHHVLTVEEALERGKELAVMFPAEGRVAAEIATLMLVHSRNANVKDLLKLAMEQARDNETWNAEWGMRLVRWHQEHRQHEEAMKVWESLKGQVKQPALKKVLDAARPAA